MSAKDVKHEDVNPDDMNHAKDAEFEDFLLGQGEFSALLQSLPQPHPSAELDAAILRDAEIALAPAAANDPAPQPGLRPPAGFFTRWRYSVGLAATLVLTMTVTLSLWRGQSLQETPRDVIGSDAKRVAAPEALAQDVPAAAPSPLPAPVAASVPATASKQAVPPSPDSTKAAKSAVPSLPAAVVAVPAAAPATLPAPPALAARAAESKSVEQELAGVPQPPAEARPEPGYENRPEARAHMKMKSPVARADVDAKRIAPAPQSVATGTPLLQPGKSISEPKQDAAGYEERKDLRADAKYRERLASAAAKEDASTAQVAARQNVASASQPPKLAITAQKIRRIEVARQDDLPSMAPDKQKDETASVRQAMSQQNARNEVYSRQQTANDNVAVQNRARQETAGNSQQEMNNHSRQMQDTSGRAATNGGIAERMAPAMAATPQRSPQAALPAAPASRVLQATVPGKQENYANRTDAVQKVSVTGTVRQSAKPAENAQSWYERIEKLLKEGKNKEALDEWQKFQAAHPAYVVPAATLRQLEVLQLQK